MAHEYSVRIHDWITEKIETIKKEKKKAIDRNDHARENYFNGQLQELSDIRQYLTDQVDLDTQKYYQ